MNTMVEVSFDTKQDDVPPMARRHLVALKDETVDAVTEGRSDE